MISEQRKEYNKNYYQRHREEMIDRTKKYFKDNPEYRKEYYQNNKERIYETQTRYRRKKSKEVSKMVLECKRRKVEQLRADGVKNAWAVVNFKEEPRYKTKWELKRGEK